MKRKRISRLKLTADEACPFTVMFEPSGMSDRLDGGEVMFADVVDASDTELEIVHWAGGISIWTQEAVMTRDSQGRELHRLN